jgi:hypothetical protein
MKLDAPRCLRGKKVYIRIALGQLVERMALIVGGARYNLGWVKLELSMPIAVAF